MGKILIFAMTVQEKKLFSGRRSLQAFHCFSNTSEEDALAPEQSLPVHKLTIRSMERGRYSRMILSELPGSVQKWQAVLLAQWNRQLLTPMEWEASWAMPWRNSRDMLAQSPSWCLKWNSVHHTVFEEEFSTPCSLWKGEACCSTYQGCWTLGLQAN